jgi:hypothetical protein
MPKLKSKLTHLVTLAGITVRPGENELTDAEIKKVVGHKDGAFFVEEAKFVIPKVKTAPKSDGKSN